jgi:hypothetical protein
MEKRYFLALLLAAAVVAITQIVFPVARPASKANGKSDTTISSTQPRENQKNTIDLPAQSESPVPAKLVDSTVLTANSTAEITTLATSWSVYRFTNLGAAPVSIALKQYKNLAAAGGMVDLGVPGQPLLRYALVLNGDTIHLDRIPFRPRLAGNPVEGGTLVYEAMVNGGLQVTIAYELVPDSYVVRIKGKIDGANGNAFLLTQLPTSLRPAEADTVTDLSNLAFSFKPQRENARIV